MQSLVAKAVHDKMNKQENCSIETRTVMKKAAFVFSDLTGAFCNFVLTLSLAAVTKAHSSYFKHLRANNTYLVTSALTTNNDDIMWD
jgi:hypothetical protein